MKRSYSCFSHPDLQVLKQQLLHWSKRYAATVLLDSNDYLHTKNQYDFILATDPLFQFRQNINNAFEALQKQIDTRQDWLFGYLSYDLKNDLEALESKHKDFLEFPELYFFQPKRLWIIKGSQVEAHYVSSCDPETDWQSITNATFEQTASENEIAPFQSRISKEDYISKVLKLQQHIARGDIYEVNFCMELFVENAKVEPHELFQQLNSNTKSPFASFIHLEDKYLLSSSPERFLKRKGNMLISQPIKGTVRRHADKTKDAEEAMHLQQNQKERAENTMIVDLVRNDMSRIAKKGSVEVKELCKVYPFRYVHQMISTVEAELSSEIKVTEAIAACFPMGSMTGAPKLRAMQLIEQYEMSKRGLYSGAVGYIDPKGDFDFNVVIRSILYRSDTRYLSMQVGSALTASSDPEREYDECLLKAKGVMETIAQQIPINL